MILTPWPLFLAIGLCEAIHSTAPKLMTVGTIGRLKELEKENGQLRPFILCSA
jgi:hypothetical protein